MGSGINNALAIDPPPISGYGSYTYFWEPFAGLSDPTAANPWAKLGETTTYTLTVSDGHHCLAMDEVTVKVGASGLDERFQEMLISVYPNPADDYVNILINGHTGRVILKILDNLGQFIDEGGGSVTSKGVCWNTTGKPTTSDNKTVNGSGLGSFSSSITNLAENTTYYVRAYATNSVGIAYGNQKEFTTTGGGGGEEGTFTDARDGKVYGYKQYGNQTWMTENLAYLPEGLCSRATEHSSGRLIQMRRMQVHW